ncbi:MAG: carbamoyltransferase HypF, partial [Deltaproteobacteria bacterium]|nr:carbamoyltransferase HypF [Deltaproteobacteria bacterium]
ADYFLVHDRDIHVRCDDSVTMIENGKPQVIRRARGYAPDPVLLPFKAREVLACGAQLKSTFCITKDQYAFISQHLGDLENLETLSHFEHMLDLYQKLFRLQPHIIAHDKHPDYLTTRFARELKNRDATIELIPVQHHHAHIVSCLTENKVTSPALGVAFDGSGYGEDGCIWGGEFFLVDHASCHRLAHLEYVPLPGGEAAIKKPYRMAISYLLTLLGTDALGKSLSFLKHIGPGEKSIIERQIEKGINTPLTSSAGRLFDGVSALMDIVKEVDYEGQAAVWLEMIAGESSEPTKLYPFEIEEKNGVKIVRLKKIFAAIVDDLIAGVPQPLIAATFHQTLAQMTACVCQACSRATGIRQVALSGGVFQNRLFATLARRYLADAGLTVITHSAIPCNDGGISLGQAVVANYLVM